MNLRFFNLLIRIGLVLFFLYSGGVKLLDLAGFYLVLESYELFDSYLILTIITYVVPLIEILIGLLLLFNSWQKIGAITGLSLMLAFIAVLSLKWGQSLEYGCGCFGQGEAEIVGIKHIFKNILLIPFLIHLMFAKEDILWLIRSIRGFKSLSSENVPSESET